MGKDFVVNLLLKQNKDSFEQGARSVDKVANNIGRLIGTATNAAFALGGLALVTSGLGAKDLQTANAIGISTKSLEKFKVATQIAGSATKGLVNEMANLDQMFTNVQLKGQLPKEKAQAIGQLGLDFNSLKNMEADDRVIAILRAAEGMKNQKEAASLVNDLLGQSAVAMFNYAKTSGTSVDNIFNKASGLVLTTDQSKQKALGFMTELNTTKAILGQISSLGGSEIGGNLTGFLQELNEFFEKNGDTIAANITKFSDALTKIGTALKPFLGDAFKMAVEQINNLTQMVANLVSGDWEGAASNLGKVFGSLEEGIATWWDRFTGKDEKTVQDNKNKRQTLKEVGNKLEELYESAYEEKNAGAKKSDGTYEWGKLQNLTNSDLATNSALRTALMEYQRAGGDVALWKQVRGIKDGIISPTGQITQVAPDDWVFAARNIGDMAQMFFPAMARGMGAGTQSVVLNQTLNISGNNTSAFEIKMAAYSGAQKALNQIDVSGQRRLLMPGTK